MDFKGWQRHTATKDLLLAACALIVLLGGLLRTLAVADTVPYNPFRSDAAQYYMTAYNLNTYGIYSQDLGAAAGHETAPKPDAYRTPGYPLFLALFVDGPPDPQLFATIYSYQALLATVGVLLVLLLLRDFPPWVSLPAALLTALSPHLISATTFVLSETLFCVLLLSALLALSLHARRPRWYLPALLVGGVLLGAAALTRAVVEFFPLLAAGLLFLNYDRRKAARGAVALLLGFCLAWAPWVARNYISVGQSGDSTTLVNTLAMGMYPDFEYNHISNRGEPDKLDPRFPQFSHDLGATLDEIGRRFRADPGEELRWYLLGKPLWLWSWDMDEGGGDVFMYPVARSPYASSALLGLSHDVMHFLHWPLVLLALVGCLLVWLPPARGWMPAEALFPARLMSLLLFYNTALLMLLAPFVRYAIPFLPFLYAMALVGVYCAYRWFGSHRGALGSAALQ